jgi:AGZA family xanthine/uracil permease-like MFS transporter
MSQNVSASPFISKGDVNAFFTLLTDNTAALVLLVMLLITGAALPGENFERGFVLKWMAPGLLVGVLIGGALSSSLAWSLSRRQGQPATAMPLGLDTPTAIAMALFVLLPTIKMGQHQYKMDLGTAMLFAWNVGMVLTMLMGLFKVAGAILASGVLQQLFPTAALMSAMAGIALALITFLPMAQDVAVVPAVGLPVLMLLAVVLFGQRKLLGGFLPVVPIAVVLGMLIFTGVFTLGERINANWPDLELLQGSQFNKIPLKNSVPSLPEQLFTQDWWTRVWQTSLLFLPMALPLALATLLGGLQCVASARAGGDDYDARSLLFADGTATILGGALGSVVQTTLYFGHPAYKTMEARSGFPLATGIVLLVIGFLGWFQELFQWVPREALFPVIVFVGLRTIAHSLGTMEAKHYPAFALACVPVLAYVALLAVNLALGSRAPITDNDRFIQSLRGLANGFVLTSVLWAAILVQIIDGKLLSAAGLLLLASGAAWIGLIHSPQVVATLALPAYALENATATAPVQTPTHWALAYLLAAAVIGLFSVASTPTRTD